MLKAIPKERLLNCLQFTITSDQRTLRKSNMSFDPLAAYKKQPTKEEQEHLDAVWKNLEKNKQLKKACPVDPQEAEQCDSCQ